MVYKIHKDELTRYLLALFIFFPFYFASVLNIRCIVNRLAFNVGYTLWLAGLPIMHIVGVASVHCTVNS
ncbi:hypothetical protein F5X98DRAFT_336312 [Xylaria grammica]|nr:hypothetical protein F5X98DRAFT_336312 [Xylaria grammica]